MTELDHQTVKLDPERERIVAMRNPRSRWRRWGPYLSARQWGTVREDYSATGDAWDFFPHEHARSRVYRWNEDGLLGFSDNQGRLCFALALWNEADSMLKERLFGLTGSQGNHGEDVKEYYFYLDATPTSSYLKALYKYPQRAFPYEALVEESHRRSRDEPEYELFDTGIFAEDRYFDVTVEYAKGGTEDLAIRIVATNRGPEPAPLHLLPTLWYRNTWSWGDDDRRPIICTSEDGIEPVDEYGPYLEVNASHFAMGDYWLVCQGEPTLLFTENEHNCQRLWGSPNSTRYVKDGIDDAVVHGIADAVNPDRVGTKVAAHYRFTINPGATATVRLRLSQNRQETPLGEIDDVIALRQAEADTFYRTFGGEHLSDDERLVQRQAFAGLLWSRQFYHFDVDMWLKGDPAGPTPPPERRNGRNAAWRHLNNADVISMPDTWEYPWYAAWDLDFHCLPLALVDPEFAKQQLILLGREWYQHPNGQLPAYEWAFDDVNPPVHAWAAWHVYTIDRRLTGTEDRSFLERVFHKLLLNFTWWVNRKDSEGNNVFQGGFLGLDNIGVFDRSKELPTGGHLEQADGTAWMGMFCLNMMRIALELAVADRVYEDIATKFFEHFLYIAGALNNLGGGVDLWDDEDEFFCDVLHLPDGSVQQIKVRSLVGLIPLLAVETIEPHVLAALPQFTRRMTWFLKHHPELASLVSHWEVPGIGDRRLVALTRGHRMKRLLTRMLDPEEFLSDHGVRALSRYHRDHPYALTLSGVTNTVNYEPAESTTGLFGGNSNWRGPIWFPTNFLLIEALRKFHHYYGDDFLIECPTNSGNKLTLAQIADDLSRRLTSLFLRASDGRRPVFGANESFQVDPHWRDHLLFYEYFHGDTGSGLGASHQTGWTALVATLIEGTTLGSP